MKIKQPASPGRMKRLYRLADCSEGWPEHGRKVHLYVTDSTSDKTLCGRNIFDVGRSPARPHRFGSFCRQCEKFILHNVKGMAPGSAVPDSEPTKTADR